MLENICGNCHQNANFLCTRCNAEFYCTKKCQVEAFPVHRRECFSLPPLKPINAEFNMPSISLSMESSESDKNSIVGLKKIEPEVEVKEISKKIETKELVVPAFNAGVRTVAPNDYKKSPSVLSIPKAVEQPEKAAEEVVKPAEKQQGFVIKSIQRNQQSSLMNQQQPKKQQPVKESRIMLSDIKVRQLAIGNVKVKIVGEYECPKAYYVTEALPAVDAFMQHIEVNINDYVKNEKSKSYKPVMNEVVLARFEGIYYRAVVEDIINDDPNKPIYGVFFMDYGNVSQVCEDDLLLLPSNLKGEIILHAVLFENFPSKVTKQLEEIFNNPDGFDIDVKEKTDKYYVANIIGI